MKRIGERILGLVLGGISDRFLLDAVVQILQALKEYAEKTGTSLDDRLLDLLISTFEDEKSAEEDEA